MTDPLHVVIPSGSEESFFSLRFVQTQTGTASPRIQS
jgi:hypothetical protein